MGLVLNWIVQGMMVAAAAGIGLWLLPAGRAARASGSGGRRSPW